MQSKSDKGLFFNQMFWILE